MALRGMELANMLIDAQAFLGILCDGSFFCIDLTSFARGKGIWAGIGSNFGPITPNYI